MRKLFVICILFIPSMAFAQHSIEGVWARGSPGAKTGGGFEYWYLSWGRRMYPRGMHIIVDLHADQPLLVIAEWAQAEIISSNETDDKTELKLFFSQEEVYIVASFHFNNDGTMWIEAPGGEPVFGTIGPNIIYHKIDGPEFDVTFDYIRRARSSNRVFTTVKDLPLHESNLPHNPADSPVIMIIPAGSLVQFRWWVPEMEIGHAWVSITAVHSAGRPKVVEAIGTTRRVLADGWVFTDMFVGMTDRFLRENMPE
ncbi:MAG: hypothetical protein FWB78_03600 [Treponema sp.]|nr:hypothetical protein [Treponema sp.]